MDQKQYIITFNSTHHALKFEKSAKENDINIIMMPVPRSIASSCGLSIKFSHRYFEKIISLIKDKELNYGGVYRIEDTGSIKDYIKLDINTL